MKSYRVAVLLGTLCCGLGSLGGCSAGAPEGASEGTAAAPSAGSGVDFRLASLDGGEKGPSDYEDKVLLVEFWATWCAPCHVQADILRDVYDEYSGRDVEFLAVSVGEPGDLVRSFTVEKPFPYPVLIDPEDRISVELGIHALPTVLVLDRAREIVYFSPGIADADTVRRALTEAGA